VVFFGAVTIDWAKNGSLIEYDAGQIGVWAGVF
jgi:hypothetical protein